MGTKKVQPWSPRVWRLAATQHWLVTRGQLLELGMSPEAIRHRLRSGRLHPVMRGVYLVGRPELTPHGCWMAAVLACGSEALLSHRSAAELWGMAPRRTGPIEVTVPAGSARRRPEIRVHRRRRIGEEMRRRVERVPVTDPVSTLIDFATCATAKELEAAVNEADRLDLVDPETLRAALDSRAPRPGVRPLRSLLDSTTFVLTESELERRFLPLAGAVGLPPPQSQAWLDGNRVDFHWPALGLVVECDGLRYHRTAAKQARDLRRDQDHMRAGRTPLRFSHYQVRYEPAHVKAMLRAVARRLGHAG